jgi:cell wall-associated NlpC family hydrolase
MTAVKSLILAALALALVAPAAHAGSGSPVPYDPVTGQALVSLARQIALGQSPWTGGCSTTGFHCVPYSWAGGHQSLPGPSEGNCQTWSRSRTMPKTLFSGPACAATVSKKHPLGYGDNGTYGLDCSGFTRWVYYLVFGQDVLGPGNSASQAKNLQRVPTGSRQPGDLAEFPGHVGIYAGNGTMIDEPHTYDAPHTRFNPSGRWVRAYARIDTVGQHVLGYYRYLIPPPGPAALLRS